MNPGRKQDSDERSGTLSDRDHWQGSSRRDSWESDRFYRDPQDSARMSDRYQNDRGFSGRGYNDQGPMSDDDRFRSRSSMNDRETSRGEDEWGSGMGMYGAYEHQARMHQAGRPQQSYSSSYDRGSRQDFQGRGYGGGSQDLGPSYGSYGQSDEDRYQSKSGGQFSGKGPKGFKRSDDRIKEEVCEMLTMDPSIDASDIEIEVKEGEVTLTGTVPERRMKHMAEDVIDGCFGVKDVHNQLRLKREEENRPESAMSKPGKSGGNKPTTPLQ